MYDDRLRGVAHSDARPLVPELELSRILIPNEDLDDGPSGINSIITDFEAKYRRGLVRNSARDGGSSASTLPALEGEQFLSPGRYEARDDQIQLVGRDEPAEVPTRSRLLMLIEATGGQAVSMNRLLVNMIIHPIVPEYLTESAKVAVEVDDRINILHLDSLFETIRAAAAIDPGQVNPALAAGLTLFVAEHKVCETCSRTLRKFIASQPD